ncbi:hypothetical protein [Chitinophaga sp. LS1]|uniref:hypothetical protein n=1 Tax=Chitinophaga sp. LS1 TaxID=3051176 RepID=UPI002AAB769E|nr:hypothetical protein [Chitinophaga sp. LS1]WPV65405.1 hypothetical protein QQL36_26750 [Chitinophaga sp. LS1]
MNVKGLNLDIDKAIDNICEVSNRSSGTTRSILYIYLIVNILSLIAVINSYKYNWERQRMEYANLEYNTLKKHLKQVLPTNTALYNEVQDSIRQKREELNILLRSDTENFTIIRIPILGNCFDLNDLGLISGITFILLGFTMRFTLTREINNLKIVFHAISERYPDDANADQFKDSGFDIKSINYTRRRHHYNYLSMNEIFNFPPLQTSAKSTMKARLGKAIMKMFYFPFIVYLSIFANDLSTVDRGIRVEPIHTIISLILSFLFALAIYYTCRECTRRKITVYGLYCAIYLNDYKYPEDMPTFNARQLSTLKFDEQTTLADLIPPLNEKK